MAKGTLDHKCLSCKAVLKFNPKGQNWKCEYCKSEFTKEEISEYEEKRGNVLNSETETVSLEQDEHGMDIYSCPNCGAEIIADESTTATFCVYCKNTAILKNKLVGAFNPDKVIPFFKTKEDAVLAFKNICKGKPFTPNEFTNPKNIDEMRGIYIPFWIYDFTVTGSINGQAKRVRSYIVGGTKHVETRTYKFMREGNMGYKMIPVDGSKNFDTPTMNSIEPYDYSALVDFTHSYLSGFLAEKYTIDSEEAIKDAISRAENTTTDVLKKKVTGYTTVNVTKTNHKTNTIKQEYVLFPVWLLNIKFENKLYMFAMNGQTGKLIGDIPIDKKKVIKRWLIVFAITFVIVILISIFIGGSV